MLALTFWETSADGTESFPTANRSGCPTRRGPMAAWGHCCTPL
jgi:hypothetical protein